MKRTLYVGSDHALKDILVVNGFQPMCFNDIVDADAYIAMHDGGINLLIYDNSMKTGKEAEGGLTWARRLNRNRKISVLVLCQTLVHDLPSYKKSAALVHEDRFVETLRKMIG